MSELLVEMTGISKSFPGVLALACLAAFLGFLVNGFAEYNFGDHEILVLLWTTVGLAVTAGRIASDVHDT